MHLITLLLKFYSYVVKKKETESQNQIVNRQKLELTSRSAFGEHRLNLCSKQTAERD